MALDITFDYRLDSSGRDPDQYSPTLRLHHQLLWSKPLPSGEILKLDKVAGHYLLHSSHLGTFSLSSDTISNSQRARRSLKPVIDATPDSDLDSFQAIGSTIGGRILFPGKEIGHRSTINVARGLNKNIADRFDLTLECIRLEYLGKENPLQYTLQTYWAFFQLFENFEGYVDFFLLQDLLEGDQIKFFLPFEQGFSNQALPTSLDEYSSYRKNTMDFVVARNERIKAWAARF